MVGWPAEGYESRWEGQFSRMGSVGFVEVSELARRLESGPGKEGGREGGERGGGGG